VRPCRIPLRLEPPSSPKQPRLILMGHRSFATDITSVMPRYLTIFRCSALAGLLCWATCPWRIVNNAP